MINEAVSPLRSDARASTKNVAKREKCLIND